MKKKTAFTLIELLIVIAILGVLAAAIMVAINPGKRSAQARDALRKSQVNSIANALVGFYALYGYYPTEQNCDTSRGSTGDNEIGISVIDCSLISGNDWEPVGPFGPSIAKQLINEGFLKRLPTDPLNNSYFYYKYEPSAQYIDDGSDERYCSPPVPCHRYWIGVRLESVDDPSKKYQMVFRCTDDPGLSLGTGCKEVEFPGALMPEYGNFDGSLYIY